MRSLCGGLLLALSAAAAAQVPSPFGIYGGAILSSSLPPATSVATNTIAFTSDQGMMIDTGTAWVVFAGSGISGALPPNTQVIGTNSQGLAIATTLNGSGNVVMDTGSTIDLTNAPYNAGTSYPSATALNAITTLNNQVIALNGTTGQITITAGTGSATFGLPSTITGPVELAGVTGATAATAGNVGEVLTASVAKGSAVSLTSTVTANVQSLSLTSGNWACSANTYLTAASGTLTYASAGLTFSSAGLPAIGSRSNLTGASFSATDPDAISPPWQFLASGTTTLYQTVVESSSATVSAYGTIYCQRIG